MHHAVPHLQATVILPAKSQTEAVAAFPVVRQQESWPKYVDQLFHFWVALGGPGSSLGGPGPPSRTGPA